MVKFINSNPLANYSFVVFIQGIKQTHQAVLISGDDWRSIQETLYLSSISGMQKSIIDGLQTPIEEADEELDW